MKNKGFTLMELLVVIAILGVLGLIVTASLNSTLKSSRQEECDEFVSEVEDGACIYVTLSRREFVCNRPGCEIPLSYLVKDGMIKSEVDSCTGKAIDLNQTVSVTWNSINGEKKCEYNGVKKYER